MISTAVMLRELRAESRKGLNYRLRAIIAGLGTLAMWLLLADSASPSSGFPIFAQFHLLMVGMGLVVSPLLTADSISRERREGTLPLLFLTPLAGGQLVATKFAAQFLRAFGFWLALLPVAVVPLMFGGVSPLHAASAVATQLLCLLLGLAGGIVVSAFARRFFRAIVGSVLAAFLFLLTDAMLVLNGYVWLVQGSFRLDYLRPETVFSGTKELLVLPLQRPPLLGIPGFPLVLAANFLLLAFAGKRLFHYLGTRLAREQTGESESARQLWFRETFLRPKFWKQAFYRTMSRRMKANPLIWLEYRHAWSRAGRWMLVAALLIFNSWLIANDWGSLWGNQVLCLWVFALLMCFSAANSFQNERETGAFELLLVAPFTEDDLFWGRIRALWSYYRPVLAGVLLSMFLVMTAIPYVFNRRSPDDLIGVRTLSLLMSFGTIPVAGLYFALRFKQFPVILALTATAAVILPTCFADVFLGLSRLLPGPPGQFLDYYFGQSSTLLLVAVTWIHYYLFSRYAKGAIALLKYRTFAS